MRSLQKKNSLFDTPGVHRPRLGIPPAPQTFSSPPQEQQPAEERPTAHTSRPARQAIPARSRPQNRLPLPMAAWFLPPAEPPLPLLVRAQIAFLLRETSRPHRVASPIQDESSAFGTGSLPGALCHQHEKSDESSEIFLRG